MKYEREPFDQNCSDLVELIPIQNQKETSTYSEESVTSSDIPKILKKKRNKSTISKSLKPKLKYMKIHIFLSKTKIKFKKPS